MFSGKMMVGMALGIFGASAYYRSRDRMTFNSANSISLKNDMIDLKEQLCNVESMVNKLNVK